MPDKVIAGYRATCVADTYIQSGDSSTHGSEDDVIVSQSPQRRGLLRFNLPFIHDRAGATVTFDSFILRLEVTDASVSPTMLAARLLRTLDYHDPEPTLLDVGWDESANDDNWSTTDNEVDQCLIQPSGGGDNYSSVSGDFTLTVPDGTGAGTTGDITWSATSATLVSNTQDALDTLAGSGNFLVSEFVASFTDGGANKRPALRIESIGARASTDLGALTASAAGFSGTATITMSTLVVGGARAWTTSMAGNNGADFTNLNQVSFEDVAIGTLDIDVTQLVDDAQDTGEHTLELRIGTNTSGGSITFDSRDKSGGTPPVLLCSYTVSPGPPTIAQVYVEDSAQFQGAAPRADHDNYIARFGDRVNTWFGTGGTIFGTPGYNQEPFGWDNGGFEGQVADVVTRRGSSYTGLLYADREGMQVYQMEEEGNFAPDNYRQLISAQFYDAVHYAKREIPTSTFLHYRSSADPSINNVGPVWTGEFLRDMYLQDIVTSQNYNDLSVPEQGYFNDKARGYTRAVIRQANATEAECGYRPKVIMIWTHRRPARLSVSQTKSVVSAMIGLREGGRTIDGIMWWQSDEFAYNAGGGEGGSGIIHNEMDADDGYDPDTNRNDPGGFYDWWDNLMVPRYLPILAQAFNSNSGVRSRGRPARLR